MKITSMFKICVGMFAAGLLVQTQVMAAPRDKPDEEPPLGTWVQQGTDLNGDGVLNGNEDEVVYYYIVNTVDSVFLTIFVEGECSLYKDNCTTNPDGTPNFCMRTSSHEPGVKIREEVIPHYPDIGPSRMLLGYSCDDDCTDECKFTITDVRP